MRFVSTQTLEERFEAKVDRSGGPEACHEWFAAKNKDGYGEIRVDSKTRRAHRIAWELAFGSIPEGLHVLHRCDNPGCVNPTHLFIGTHTDNMKDQEKKGRNHDFNSYRRHPRAWAKLTEEKAAEIRRLRAEGFSRKELATRFGVSRDTVWSVVTGRTWA